MEAAAQASRQKAAALKRQAPKIVGVTVLTSDANTNNVAATVLERARLAQQSHLDGVVASPQEAEMIRKELGKEFVIVTPGIRPASAATDDQKRIATPKSAIESGSSFVVVGRPIVKAEKPRQAAEDILQEIKSAAN